MGRVFIPVLMNILEVKCILNVNNNFFKIHKSTHKECRWGDKKKLFHVNENRKKARIAKSILKK